MPTDNITFQVEPYRDVYMEIMDLVPLHHEEVDDDRDIIKIDPDHNTYFMLDETGKLMTITVRNHGELVGYMTYIINTHLHYKDVLTAFDDSYYILPQFRKNGTGKNMFKFAIEQMKDRGVKLVYATCKIKHDLTHFLEDIGFNRYESVHTMILEN